MSNPVSSVPPPEHLGGDHLDTPVRDLMSPGVLSLVEDASLRHVLRAMRRHRVHAVVVCGRRTGAPLGWVTTRGLLAWVERDPSLAVRATRSPSRRSRSSPAPPCARRLR